MIIILNVLRNQRLYTWRSLKYFYKNVIVPQKSTIPQKSLKHYLKIQNKI